MDDTSKMREILTHIRPTHFDLHPLFKGGPIVNRWITMRYFSVLGQRNRNKFIIMASLFSYNRSIVYIYY